MFLSSLLLLYDQLNFFPGSPAVILAIFYTVTYNLYKYAYDDLAVDHIYGDVNNNGQM